MRQTMDDEKVAAKLSSEDNKLIRDKIADTLHWIENNTTATKEELEFKLKEAEHVCYPVISRLYQQPEGQCGSQAGPQNSGEGPKIDEVD